MKNRVKIEVFGTEYPITTQEDPAYVRQMGEEIDGSVRSIMKSTGISLPEALVLLSLSYLDSYKKSENSADNLREQLASYLEEATQAKIELTKAKADLERLNRDYQLSIE